VRLKVIQKGTVVTSKPDLYELLYRWHRETNSRTLGEVGTFGGQVWIWLELPDLPRRARLNADTSREAVRDYLDDVARRGADVPWRVITNRRGSMNKVTFTDDGRLIPGWYCYLV
jgi:hypothetical protein